MSALSENQNIDFINIEKEMSDSYLDYAMSVIVSRAIPDVRDGLKPVHRRILYSMYEAKIFHNVPYKKSARVVGDVLGKYHPHGDSSIYDALVRMAQPFAMRVPLIDGQGNFGSMDGDSAAAMRYTESRLQKISSDILQDLDKNTVDFTENYDGSEKEPTVLPARYPNLLVNGSNGIAVGMATNIPPHNLGEIIDATIAYIQNNDITIEEVANHVKGPDFPTGGSILGRKGIYDALKTGRGSIMMRAKTHIEDIANKRKSIVVTEIPYQVNKARLVERIAELVREKKIEGVSDLRDESDMTGVRIVIELKRDASTDVLLNQLYSYSQLQTSYGVNMLALHNGKPKQLSILDVLKAFIEFRQDVVHRRIAFLLEKARTRAHLLIGLTLALDSIDEVVSIIRASKDTASAKKALLSKSWKAVDVLPLINLVDDHNNVIEGNNCYFTEQQVQAILDMRLARLTGLERDKISEELVKLGESIQEYLILLADKQKILSIIEEELVYIKETFSVPRLTVISDAEFNQDIEELIVEEEMIVTTTIDGYIKRQSVNDYKSQKRGGKGKNSIKLSDTDSVVTEIFIASTHSYMLFFSSTGLVYRMKVYKLPLSSSQSKGRAFVNLLPLAEGEIITNILALPKDENEWMNLNLMFATQNGNIRRSDMEDFRRINVNGKVAIRLEEGDSLVAVRTCEDSDHVMLATAQGKAIRFSLDGIRVIKSRTSNGIRGIRLTAGDRVISLTIVPGFDCTTEERSAFLKIDNKLRIELREKIMTLSDEEEIGSLIANNIEETDVLSYSLIRYLLDKESFILSITENGYGKRTSVLAYNRTNRGGIGVINIVTSERNGEVVASFQIDEDNDIMLVTNRGKMIRSPANQIGIVGRSTQGVTILKVSEGEKVVSVATVITRKDEEDEGEEINDAEQEKSDDRVEE